MPEAAKNTNPSTDKYESIIGSTTFTVVSKYTGDKPLLDFLKAAVKRDVEIAIGCKKDAISTKKPGF